MMGGKVAAVYADLIRKELKKIEDVPKGLREAVKAILAGDVE